MTLKAAQATSKTSVAKIFFENAIGLPDNLVARDGSIAIRVVKDPFCIHLIKRFRKPLVSTSANLHGEETPALFKNISLEVQQRVEYIVKWKKESEEKNQPPQMQFH